MVPLQLTWPSEVKIEKPSIGISQANGSISKEFHRNVCLRVLYQNCDYGSTPLNKMAARAKNRKKKSFKGHLLKLMAQFQNNFAEMFLLWPCTKLAKMVPLHWTRWPPELKIENNLNDISSQADGSISKQFHRNVPLMVLYQLRKWFHSTEQDGLQSLFRNIFPAYTQRQLTHRCCLC